MAGAKVDWSGLAAKLRAIRSERPHALADCGKLLADRVMGTVILDSPKDTHRYVAAMAQAANGARLGPFRVPDIRAGRFAEQALPRLQAQLSKWQMIVDRYERQNRRDKWYRKAVKTRDRAKEELQKWAPDAVIIFGGGGRSLKVTVRNKIYGGEGWRKVEDGRVAFAMHNKEPHASIVEARSRVLWTAMAEARAFGFRFGGRAYTRRIIAAAAQAGGGGGGGSAGPLFSGRMGTR